MMMMMMMRIIFKSIIALYLVLITNINPLSKFHIHTNKILFPLENWPNPGSLLYGCCCFFDPNLRPSPSSFSVSKKSDFVPISARKMSFSANADNDKGNELALKNMYQVKKSTLI